MYPVDMFGCMSHCLCWVLAFKSVETLNTCFSIVEFDFFSFSFALCVCVYRVVVIAQVHFSDVCQWTTSLGLSAHTRPENVQQEQERRGRGTRRVKLDGYSVRGGSMKGRRRKRKMER